MQVRGGRPARGCYNLPNQKSKCRCQEIDPLFRGHSFCHALLLHTQPLPYTTFPLFLLLFCLPRFKITVCCVHHSIMSVKSTTIFLNFTRKSQRQSRLVALIFAGTTTAVGCDWYLLLQVCLMLTERTPRASPFRCTFDRNLL